MIKSSHHLIGVSLQIIAEAPWVDPHTVAVVISLCQPLALLARQVWLFLLHKSHSCYPARCVSCFCGTRCTQAADMPKVECPTCGMTCCMDSPVANTHIGQSCRQPFAACCAAYAIEDVATNATATLGVRADPRSEPGAC